MIDIIRELAAFVLRRPRVPTLVRFANPSDRNTYRLRIRQRIGSSVDAFAVLNIHRVSIDAPALIVWDEILRWGPESTCWPGRIAKLKPRDGRDDVLEVFLFGRQSLFGRRRHLLGFEVVPLITMQLERRQERPGALDPDNGRFLLYRCVGGYPIGLFSMYVRSSIASEGERDRAQLFFVVAFDFYGRPHWSRSGPIRWIWERIHNRVTGHVLNRFKQECEAQFASVQAGA